MEYDKKIFSENLKKQAAIAGENQPDIAEVLGVTKSAVNAYFMGNKIPRMDRIKKLADHFGCNVSDLVDDKSIEDQITAVAIPVLGTVPAGVPIEAIQDILGYEEIPKIMANTGEFFCLRVEGNSMYPLLYSGETIVIKKQETADNGDIIVALVDNEETTVKRLKKVSDGIILEAENPEYNSLYFNEKQIKNEKVKIIGKAVESRKKL